MDYNHEVITGDYTCAYSYAYRSIMGNGTITEVTDPGAKKKGLGKIMAHIAPEAKIAFLPEMVERVAVWRIDIYRQRAQTKIECSKLRRLQTEKDSRKDSRND